MSASKTLFLAFVKMFEASNQQKTLGLKQKIDKTFA